MGWQHVSDESHNPSTAYFLFCMHLKSKDIPFNTCYIKDTLFFQIINRIVHIEKYRV